MKRLVLLIAALATLFAGCDYRKYADGTYPIPRTTDPIRHNGR